MCCVALSGLRCCARGCCPGALPRVRAAARRWRGGWLRGAGASVPEGLGVGFVRGCGGTDLSEQRSVARGRLGAGNWASPSGTEWLRQSAMAALRRDSWSAAGVVSWALVARWVSVNRAWGTASAVMSWSRSVERRSTASKRERAQSEAAQDSSWWRVSSACSQMSRTESEPSRKRRRRRDWLGISGGVGAGGGGRWVDWGAGGEAGCASGGVGSSVASMVSLLVLVSRLLPDC